MTKAVEDAIRECGMGLNPSSEGQGQVNVPIPKPTKESREAVAKVAAKQTEKVHTSKQRGRVTAYSSLARQGLFSLVVGGVRRRLF